MNVIGEGKSERLDKVPAMLRVIVTRRPQIWLQMRRSGGAGACAAAPDRPRNQNCGVSHVKRSQQGCWSTAYAGMPPCLSISGGTAKKGRTCKRHASLAAPSLISN
jgi:hypothetical protein